MIEESNTKPTNSIVRIIHNPHGERIGTIDFSTGTVTFEADDCKTISNVCENIVENVSQKDVSVSSMENEVHDVLSVFSYEVVDPNRPMKRKLDLTSID